MINISFNGLSTSFVNYIINASIDKDYNLSLKVLLI